MKVNLNSELFTFRVGSDPSWAVCFAWAFWLHLRHKSADGGFMTYVEMCVCVTFYIPSFIIYFRFYESIFGLWFRPTWNHHVFLPGCKDRFVCPYWVKKAGISMQCTRVLSLHTEISGVTEADPSFLPFVVFIFQSTCFDIKAQWCVKL